MPVTLAILGGTPANEIVSSIQPQAVYTRKQRRDSRPPKSSDSHAWRWQGDDPPTEVVRSPINPESWVTAHERQCIVSELLPKGWAFARRKGWALVKGEEGATGWCKVNGHGLRRFHIFKEGIWQRENEFIDSGY